MQIKNNILITGASGLLGGVLTYLLHETSNVIALVRKNLVFCHPVLIILKLISIVLGDRVNYQKM